MLNFDPFSSRSHKFTLGDYRDGRETPPHSIGLEPHIYRPKRKCNSVTQEGKSRWSNRRGGFLPPPRVLDYLI